MTLNILLITLLLVVILRNAHDTQNEGKYLFLMNMYNTLLNRHRRLRSSIVRRPDFD